MKRGGLPSCHSVRCPTSEHSPTDGLHRSHEVLPRKFGRPDAELTQHRPLNGGHNDACALEVKTDDDGNGVRLTVARAVEIALKPERASL